LPSAPYQQTAGDTYHAAGGRTVMIETNANEPDILAAVWENGDPAVLSLTSRVSTRGHAIDLTSPSVPPPRDLSAFGHFLRPTKFIPIDGIVKKTADAITRGAGTDFERARAIYEWIVDNTFRDPKTRGCGVGDVKSLLESGNLGGKCADLNALYVGLARSVGVPARDAYGIRVAPSKYGYKSLGTGSPNITKAQHCRAEFFARGYGWVPVDPADVRKVVLEEPPGNLPVKDEKVLAARKRLFGSWEMNWLAYNMGHDVKLPNATKAPTLPFLMYINAEADGELRDQLEPDSVRYTITSREISV
jgi:transglutaminase-like putative cysteine protease